MHIRPFRALGTTATAMVTAGLLTAVLPAAAPATVSAAVPAAVPAVLDAGAGVAASVDGPVAGRQSRRITLRTPDHPVALGSMVRVGGRVAGPRRRVWVQQRTIWGRWRTVSAARTDRRGRFEVRVRARAVGRMLLRSSAPAHGRRPAVQSAPRAVDALRQRGSITAIPPIAGPGPTPVVPTARAQVLARFTPPLPGGVVRLERRGDRGWRQVGKGRQNLSGAVAFAAVPGARYRAVASPGVRTAAVTARAHDLLFAEDFTTVAGDGRSPDPASWIDQPRPAPTGRTCAINDPTVRSVSGGVLHLRVAPDPRRAGTACSYVHQGKQKTAPWLLTTQVATAKSFSFTHGYAAARIRMHSHTGAHASFWLLPKKSVPDTAPEWHDVSYVNGDPSRGTEIDIVEYWANPPRPGVEPAIGSFVHWYDAAGATASWGYLFPGAGELRPPGSRWDESFHVFSVHWTPTELVFMVDGQVYARDSRAVSQVPQYVVLSMLSGDYELDRVGPDLFGDSAEVDWVRVWAS